MKKFIIDYDKDTVVTADMVPTPNGRGWVGVDSNGQNQVKMIDDVFDCEMDALELQLGEVIQQKNQVFLLEQRILHRLLELLPSSESVDVIG